MMFRDWLAILGIAATATMTLVTWSFWTGARNAALTDLIRRLEKFERETEKRFEDANEATSKAWSYVQGLESKFLREFAAVHYVDIRSDENKRAIDQLRAELDGIRHRQQDRG